MKNVAVVPVKAVSERVESKNFKDFYNGESLFQILLNKLKDSKSFDEIYVSSNSINLRDNLEKQGIYVRAEGRRTLQEEVPEAYKDVDEVVRVVDKAGLSRRVARLRPIGVVKG